MKRMLIGAAVFVAALATLRRFGPVIRESGMKKCHQMMNKCQEMFGQQASSSADSAYMSTAGPGPKQAAADEAEQAVATRAS